MTRFLRWIAGVLSSLPPVSRYVVDGPSMEPAYSAGDRLVVNRLAYGNRRPKPGDAVVLRDPADRSRLLLKRISAAPDHIEPGPQRLYVLGDNPDESRDSRQFGLVHRRDIVGRVWFRY